MVDYKSSTASGSIWQRASGIYVNNVYGQIPSVQFQEERAVRIGSEVLTQPLRARIIEQMFDPNIKFPLLDFNTGNPLGKEITYGELQVILFSMYMFLAAKQDAVEAAQAAMAQNAPPTVPLP